jgi:hypothetical protein
VRSEVKNTSLAATYVKSHLLMLGSLDISSHWRKRVISTSFRAVLLAGGRPRFFMHAVATSGAMHSLTPDSHLPTYQGMSKIFFYYENQFIIYYLIFNI